MIKLFKYSFFYNHMKLTEIMHNISMDFESGRWVLFRCRNHDNTSDIETKLFKIPSEYRMERKYKEKMPEHEYDMFGDHVFLNNDIFEIYNLVYDKDEPVLERAYPIENNEDAATSIRIKQGDDIYGIDDKGIDVMLHYNGDIIKKRSLKEFLNDWGMADFFDKIYEKVS